MHNLSIGRWIIIKLKKFCKHCKIEAALQLIEVRDNIVTFNNLSKNSSNENSIADCKQPSLNFNNTLLHLLLCTTAKCYVSLSFSKS